MSSSPREVRRGSTQSRGSVGSASRRSASASRSASSSKAKRRRSSAAGGGGGGSHSSSKSSRRRNSRSNSKSDLGNLELRRLCEVAKDEKGWEKVRRWILSHSGVETQTAILQLGENGTSAIHLACKNLAPLDVVEMILNACEDALELSDDHGFCALHYACHYGAKEEVLKVLILSCPKILKKKDSKGRNPLHFAVGNKFKATPISPSIFTMLTQSGAARQMEAKGMLPIHYSCAYGTSVEVIKILIEAFPDSINYKDDIGFTPLCYAMGNCERDESPGAIETLLTAKTSDPTFLEKHPLLIFSDRAKQFKEANVSKTGCENAIKCLQVYLRHKPEASTSFFTALQSLPQWLEDQAVVEPYVQELLNQNISRKFPTAIMILDFYSILLTLITYMLAVLNSIDRRADITSSNSVPSSYLIPLYIAGSYFAIREIVQILSFIHLGLIFASWFKRTTNWMEISLIIQIIFWTVVMDTGAFTLEFFQAGTALTLFFLWLNFLKYLRSMIVEFAVFVSGVIHVLQRLGVFMLALLIILIAFMQIFYILFLGSGYCEGFQSDRSHAEVCDPEGAEPYRFCTRWDAFLSVYTMLLGEVDEGDFKSSVFATLMFAFFVFLVVILLANVLIAIVTDSYSVIRNQRAAIVFWSNRLDFIVEMDVISNGPVTRKLQNLFSTNDNDSESLNTPHTTTSERRNESFTANMWNHVMELFDQDSPYLTVDTGSLAFLCLNFLRFIAIFIVIPIWFTIGLVFLGLLWPPQIRQKMMRQTITMEKSTKTIKAEQQKNNLAVVQRSMTDARQELTTSLTRQKEQVEGMKKDLTTLHKDVMFEMQHVKETLETLLNIQESRGELTKLRFEAKDYAAIQARNDEMKVQFDKLQMEKNETQNALDKLESEVEEKEQERNDTGDKYQGDMDKLKKENDQLKVMLQMQK